MLLDALHGVDLACTAELPVKIWPLILRDPFRGIVGYNNLSSWPGEQIPPLLQINLMITLLNLNSQDKGKEQLMFLKQGPTNILIQGIGKRIIHIPQPLLQDIRSHTALNGHNKQPREPLQ